MTKITPEEKKQAWQDITQLLTLALDRLDGIQEKPIMACHLERFIETAKIQTKLWEDK